MWKWLSTFLHKFGLIPRNWLLNTVYQEVVSLPFNSESQGAISKTASHVWWILWLVTEELAGEHRLFRNKEVRLLSHLLIFYLCDSLPSMNPYKALLLKKRSSLKKLVELFCFWYYLIEKICQKSENCGLRFLRKGGK